MLSSYAAVNLGEIEKHHESFMIEERSRWATLTRPFFESRYPGKVTDFGKTKPGILYEYFGKRATHKFEENYKSTSERYVKVLRS